MIKFTRSIYLFFRLCAIFLFLGSLNRLLFYLFNQEYFLNPGLWDFLFGLRFDLVSVSYGFLPVFIGLLIPLNHLGDRFLRFTRIYSSVVLILFNLVNAIDVIYYRFTLKRTTWDIFRYLSTGDDFAGLIPQFLRDYWYMIPIFLLLSWFSVYLIFRYIQPVESFSKNPKLRIAYRLLMLFMVFVGVRGGLQLKPLNIIDASRYTNAQNAPLVLSTPFSMMKSLGRNQLAEVAYFSEEEALDYFDPVFIQEDDSHAVKKNVVVIIMESFSREYIGYYNNGEGYTPFLDSLMQHSTVFMNAFANGKRSIEALPAIFSGLPNLMTEAHGTSVYGGNTLSSLAKVLKEQGYYSAFYHGGENGTMGFNSYTGMAGFDVYKGMDEYPDEEDYDGSWGIYDVPYFQYFAREQSTMKEPFLSAIFSLSAHHPYKLPEEYTQACKDGELQIHPMVCYSDQALKAYFSEARKQKWYDRTIFLITADHTAQSVKKSYSTSMGIYAIPLVIFEPGMEENKEIERITQQADVSPSILDMLGLDCRSIFFGKSALGDSPGFAMNYINNFYQFIDDKYCIQFDGKQFTAIYKYKEDHLLEHNLVKEIGQEADLSKKKCQAIIQQYNRRMIQNELIYND